MSPAHAQARKHKHKTLKINCLMFNVCFIQTLNAKPKRTFSEIISLSLLIHQLVYYLNKFGGADEVDGVVVVFLHACSDREDVGIKDDVIGVKSHFRDQQLVRPGADLHFTLSICSLENSTC